MQLVSYLNFNGNCRESFTFYEKVLGGKIAGFFTHADTPMGEQAAPEWRDSVMHVRLEIGDAVLMGSDAGPMPYDKPQGFAVSLHVKDIPEAERIYPALSEGGNVAMPLQETFWASRFAMFT